MVAAGSRVVVWGIRARRAPVITVSAWGAREGDTAPGFVEQPARGIPSFEAGVRPMQVAGGVPASLHPPPGEVMDAIPRGGVVVRVPPATADALGDQATVSRQLAASGLGAIGPTGRAVDAVRIGDAPGNLGSPPAVSERGR